MAHTRKLDDIDLIELEIEIDKKTHLIESIGSVARKVRNLAERLNDDSETFFTLRSIDHFLRFLVANTAGEIAAIKESLPRVRKEVDENNRANDSAKEPPENR